ncbi:3'(2'),5'-bisphosphate nucleotidase CysQ [Candidatus Nomurabacteria bacterium]|nr:3'(2'),5'-bisphosphate nucleotidase CysQ [Candidatus Nomurabacteria bacterium]
MNLQGIQQPEPSHELRIIIDIALHAGDILLKHFKQNIAVEYKNSDDFDPVSTADKESDEYIRNELKKQFPNDFILSEENDAIPTDCSKRIWMVDPLDGTKDFLKGKDGFAIHIGLLENGMPTLGVVYAPARKRLFWAQKGQGAYEKTEENYRRIHVSTLTDLNEVRIITRSPGSDKRELDAVVEKMPRKESIHDSGIKVPKIACGEAELHINTNLRASKWDTLAPQVILEEAGGCIADICGNELDYAQPELKWKNSYIAASNRSLLEQVYPMVKEFYKIDS